jgi:Relaxase/Mobilisation nuclease domain
MPSAIDGLLVQWGDRLFYPSNRVKPSCTSVLTDAAVRQRAQILRQRIRATVERRAPQVMVKVTGGGHGMDAIAAHLRYIAKAGRLPIEDDRGAMREGRDALRAIADQWRFGGTRIPEVSERREAFNMMPSMPTGTDARVVQQAAREFAKAELANHRYVMVLHRHQANPHVHISVRSEGRDGKRLNPSKEDLHRWRETFAEKLRYWGIEAEASSQFTRGSRHHNERLRQRNAREQRRACERGEAANTKPDPGMPARGAGLVRDRQDARVVGRHGRSRTGSVGRQLRALVVGGALQATREATAARVAGARTHDRPEDAV